MEEDIDLLDYSMIRDAFVRSANKDIGFFKSYLEQIGPLENFSQFNTELIQKYLEGLVSTEEALKLLDEDLYKNIKIEANPDWGDIAATIGRNNLFNFFYEVRHQISDESYWRGLSICYTLSDFSFKDSEFIREMLQVDRPNNKYLMTEEEREYLKALPSELTIYRGCSVAEINSNKLRFSWTLNKDVANFFSNTYKKNMNTKCSVVTKKIDKSSVIAYFKGRNEDEIIYLG